MFQIDEQAIRVPQESGADVWQNGRTGEMANFAVFKVHHTRDNSGRIRYEMEREGVGVAQHPFTGQAEEYTFVLAPPLGSVPKSDNLEDKQPVYQPKPRVDFWDDWGFFIALIAGMTFWVSVIIWLGRLVCR